MSTALAPVLSIVQGQPRVLSSRIAEHFGKPHNRVLQVVRTTMEGLPEQFRLSNFRQTTIRHAMPAGKGFRNDPVYELTRDGFTLVVMGFTGKEAMAWKIRYIEAFNRMEEELRGQVASPSRLTTAKERSQLAVLINRYIGALPTGPSKQAYKAAWRKVHDVLGIGSVEELTVEQLPRAVTFLQALVDALPAGEPMKALPPAVEDLIPQALANQSAYRPEMRTIEAAVMAALDQLNIIREAVCRAAHKADGSNITVDTSLAQKSANMVSDRAAAIRKELFELETLATLGFAGIATHLELKQARNRLREIERESGGKFKAGDMLHRMF